MPAKRGSKASNGNSPPRLSPTSNDSTHFSPSDKDIGAALQRLRDKLRSSEPQYTEDDVAEIPFPLEGGSPSHSPARAEEPLTPLLLAEDKLSPTTGVGVPSGGSSLNLDIPLSLVLFSTAVNLFDAKLVSKSRRVAQDAVKLVKQGYALVWRDSEYIENTASTARALLPSRSASVGFPDTPHPRSSAQQSPCARRSLTLRTNGQSTLAVKSPSPSPAPVFRPPDELVRLLADCVQVVLVYANVSYVLRHTITSSEGTLRLFCFICSAAHQMEQSMRGPVRSAEEELCALEDMWRGCGVDGPMIGSLRQCYLIEFLLDAGLPPAVCSSRYDGLQAALMSKKEKIVLDITASRHSFPLMMRTMPLRGIAGMVNVSACADPKLRVRLLSKMTTEGLVEKLSAEIQFAVEGLMAPPSSPAAGKPKCLSPPSRRGTGRSPRGETSRAGSSAPGSASPSPGRSTARSPSPSAPPTSPTSRSFPWEEDPPLQRLGLCIDILLLLTSPNLRGAAETEELLRNPKTAGSAITRCITWSTHEKPLQDIIMHLLRVLCVANTPCMGYSPAHTMSMLVHAQAADCILHIAAYSGSTYGMVVECIDVFIADSLVGASEHSGKQSGGRTHSPVKGPPTSMGDGSVPVPALDPSGLLGLFVPLLLMEDHAEANRRSIVSWFGWLAEKLLPQVFEAPVLTLGRRSSSAWGRRRLEKAEECTTQGSGWWKREAPVLARDLTREEIQSLSSYFSFCCRVICETTWRDGCEGLFAKMASLSYNVVVNSRRRSNIYVGQAAACYDSLAPILEPVQGAAPGEKSLDVSMDEDAPSTPPRLLSTDRSPARSSKRGRRGQMASPSKSEELFQTFIPSPSSPLFYDAYSSRSTAHEMREPDGISRGLLWGGQ